MKRGILTSSPYSLKGLSVITLNKGKASGRKSLAQHVIKKTNIYQSVKNRLLIIKRTRNFILFQPLKS